MSRSPPCRVVGCFVDLQNIYRMTHCSTNIIFNVPKGSIDSHRVLWERFHILKVYFMFHPVSLCSSFLAGTQESLLIINTRRNRRASSEKTEGMVFLPFISRFKTVTLLIILSLFERFCYHKNTSSPKTRCILSNDEFNQDYRPKLSI
jgi:hypothetical protein